MSVALWKLTGFQVRAVCGDVIATHGFQRPQKTL